VKVPTITLRSPVYNAAEAEKIQKKHMKQSLSSELKEKIIGTLECSDPEGFYSLVTENGVDPNEIIRDEYPTQTLLHFTIYRGSFSSFQYLLEDVLKGKDAFEIFNL